MPYALCTRSQQYSSERCQRCERMCVTESDVAESWGRSCSSRARARAAEWTERCSECSSREASEVSLVLRCCTRSTTRALIQVLTHRPLVHWFYGFSGFCGFSGFSPTPFVDYDWEILDFWGGGLQFIDILIKVLMPGAVCEPMVLHPPSPFRAPVPLCPCIHVHRLFRLENVSRIDKNVYCLCSSDTVLYMKPELRHTPVAARHRHEGVRRFAYPTVFATCILPFFHHSHCWAHISLSSFSASAHSDALHSVAFTLVVGCFCLNTWKLWFLYFLLPLVIIQLKSTKQKSIKNQDNDTLLPV